MRFKINAGCGSHEEPDGSTYKAGDEFESDRELDVIFARMNKFTRVSSPAGGNGQSGPPPATGLGDDVTSVVAEGPWKGKVRVHQNGSWFNVTDLEGNKLNSKALRSKELGEFLNERFWEGPKEDEPEDSEDISKSIAEIAGK